jgi:CubicO group peptidase (beta-lactamase class C family)
VRNTTTVLAALAIGLAAIGISIAPSAAADNDSSNCQTIGAATMCGQGGVRGGGPSEASPGPVSGPPAEGGCLTPYGDCAMKSDVDALMRNYTGDVPGAAVLVLRDGQPIVRAGYGLADLETDTPATPETNYRLASVTKQFTAASILLLAEDGRLKLDDRVRTWLPSLPKAAETVTIRHLLTHTSGLIDYEEVIPEVFAGQLHDADVLRLLETQDRTYFRPGTGYRYSNSGYALLALIVERASGKTFATFLRERIFQPLGMNNTVAYEEGISTVNNRAFGYTEEAGRWNRTDQSQTSAVLGDGGIYSSIDDLAKWDAALYDGRLLRPSSLQAAFTPATHTDDPEVEYGYGWRITGETLWHSGETVGFRNVIVRYPKRHMTVVVLTNRNEPEPYQLALEIAKMVIASRSP